HGGFECDLKTGEPLTESRENEACRICRELDFDLVLTGHQHMRVDGVHFGHSYAVQPGYRAPHACAVTVTVHEDGSKSFASEILPASAEPLPGASALLAPLEQRVQAWLDTPAGHLDIPLQGGDHLSQAVHGSPLANFINTVQLAASGAQISACSLPNEFKGLPTTVTVRDVVSTYIYTNTLVVLALDRAALRQYMERSAMYFAIGSDGQLCIANEFLAPKVEHYNYDYFSGVDYVIDVRRPAGERVTSIRLNGRELGEDETVTVCINSYRSCGTGGYGFLVGQKVVADIQVDVADAMIEYIMTHPQIRVDTHRYCEVRA
ncbi:MAG: 5'-nucleotidase C-terminal domain-containing protein, partial [Candidatus Ventricola sp.]|nr:5'-nucleotidase C-terminal domain-containing protein [Candidatus Ventricola sp.]